MRLFTPLVWDAFIYFTVVPDWSLHAFLRQMSKTVVWVAEILHWSHEYIFVKLGLFSPQHFLLSFIMFIFYFAFPAVALFPSSKVSSLFGLESHFTGNTFSNFSSELIIFHMNERLQDLCPRLIRKRMQMIRKINYKQARVTSDSSSPLLRYFHIWQNMEIPEKSVLKI